MFNANLRCLLLPMSMALLVGLAGCSASGGGVEQGDPPIDEVTGCPDLSGTYAVVPPDRERGVTLDGSAWSSRSGGRDGVGAVEHYDHVVVASQGTHVLDLRFAYPHTKVMAELEMLREYEKPRYGEWYRLMQAETRAAFVATNGEARMQARLAELGPRTTHTVSFERNRDYTCDDGWLVFPRAHGGPIRMTLDPRGALVAESREISTYGVTIWCGDGCKDLPIPTGTYTGTMRWPSDPSRRAWNADEVARAYVFARPVEQVEAEQREIESVRRRNAERRFATPDQVREALTPLLPEGVVISTVELSSLPFKGARVRVHAVPADAGMPYEDQNARQSWFLATLREGDPGHIEDSEVIQRVILSGGRQRAELEVFLDTHPAVQPRERALADAPVPVVIDFIPAPGTAPADSALVPVASAETPAGLAMRERLAGVMGEGCSIDTVKEAGDAWQLDGSAPRMECISQTLRHLYEEAAGFRDAELVQINADAAGRYRFTLRFRSRSPEAP